MATEADNKKEKMSKTVTSLSFNNDNNIDQPLIQAANEFASLPENQGIPTTPLLRNFITIQLNEANEKSRSRSQNKLKPTG